MCKSKKRFIRNVHALRRECVFYSGPAGIVEKPFHPQAQISWWPANAGYLFLLFLIFRGLNAVGNRPGKLTVRADYGRLSWGNRGI